MHQLETVSSQGSLGSGAVTGEWIYLYRPHLLEGFCAKPFTSGLANVTWNAAQNRRLFKEVINSEAQRTSTLARTSEPTPTPTPVSASPLPIGTIVGGDWGVSRGADGGGDLRLYMAGTPPTDQCRRVAERREKKEAPDSNVTELQVPPHEAPGRRLAWELDAPSHPQEIPTRQRM